MSEAEDWPETESRVHREVDPPKSKVNVALSHRIKKCLSGTQIRDKK